MSKPATTLRPKGKRRVILWVLLAVSAVVGSWRALAALGLLWSGWADGWVRRTVIEQAGNLTGGTVDLGSIRSSNRSPCASPCMTLRFMDANRPALLPFFMPTSWTLR